MTIKHLFLGTNCIIDRALSNRTDLEQKLIENGFNFSRVLLLNQIHSNEVMVIDDDSKFYGDQGLPKADGIITNLPNVAIGVVTADCAPILLKDEEQNIIAAVHAGWPGAKANIIANAVRKMRELGAKKIKAIIGPMIHKLSYEVSPDFRDDFLQDDLQNEIFFTVKNKEKFWFDLPAYVEKKLQQESVTDIANTRIDTYANEKDFFSYRRATHRDQENNGRNVSLIILQDRLS